MPLQKLAAIPERADRYPEFSMFGELPAWGFYVRHAEGITFENVALSAKAPDFRSAFVFDDAENILLKTMRIAPTGEAPVIFQREVKNLRLQDAEPPAATKEGLKN